MTLRFGDGGRVRRKAGREPTVFSNACKSRHSAPFLTLVGRTEQLRILRPYALLVALLLGLLGAPQTAHAGGLKMSDTELVLKLGSVIVGPPLAIGYIGSTIHFARATSLDRSTKRGWDIVGAITGTTSLLMLGVGPSHRDLLREPIAPIFHSMGALAGQLSAFAYASRLASHRPVRERYGLSWLMGAPAYSSCYFLLDAAQGNLLMKGPAALALLFGTAQTTGATLWLARGTSDHRALLQGTVAWGGVTASYGLASLLMQERARKQHFGSVYPYASVGRERSLGVTVSGAF